MFQFCSTCWTMLVCSMELDTLLKIQQAWLQFLEPLSWPVPVWFRFGSVSVSSICYRPGSVHVRFRFLRFLVDFGSVRFVGKANTDCFPKLVSWAAAFKERTELNSENESFLKLSMHAIYYEETHICFFHWTQKAITTFPISLLGEGKTVPVPPVRFCTRFQRFTVPTVHRLFDFLRFGSTVRVRFQNLTAVQCFSKYCNHLMYKPPHNPPCMHIII